MQPPFVSTRWANSLRLFNLLGVMFLGRLTLSRRLSPAAKFDPNPLRLYEGQFTQILAKRLDKMSLTVQNPIQNYATKTD